MKQWPVPFSTPSLLPASKPPSLAEKNIEADHEADIAQWRLQVERARYETERAERRYRSVEPENRLVARTLEAEWESRLSELAAAEAELARRQSQHPWPHNRRAADADPCPRR